ncbi:MAG: sugar phosphate isomerase/epimerase [Planctomycetales bacterium]|nr:sugar phosphate isomerase/epimerase [Planctomycetales bacterium]
MKNDRLEAYPMLTRRAALGAVAATMGSVVVATEAQQRSRLGLVAFNCAIRRRWMQQQDPKVDLFEPLTFLKHCRDVGAGGMQVSLDVLDAARVKALRDFAAEHSLCIDGIVNPPKDEADLARFEAEIRTASEVGVQAVRTVVMPGRRYEQFKSLAEVREAEAKAVKMLELAAPIVTKYRVRLAVENHKDQRIVERLALYKPLRCEFIGATVDTGNSFALLDDPYGAIEELAPYAFSVHFKDQALREYEHGFLLADIPLGQGSFDMKRVAAILRRAKPDIRMMLELITRDPLKVPCLSEKFWATMPQVSGDDLGRTLRFVREHPAKSLQEVGSLSLEKQVELEDANIAASVKYAREELAL